MKSVYEEHISAEAWFIPTEQISLNNFIIIRKKTGSNTSFSVESVKLLRTVVFASENP